LLKFQLEKWSWKFWKSELNDYICLMISLYGKYVFKGSKKFWHNGRVEYLGVWEDSEEEFLKTYHFKYPNEQLQIYRHKYKPLSRDMRGQIENYMRTDPFFIQQKREEKLDDLLS
jgi:hypothetical protein